MGRWCVLFENYVSVTTVGSRCVDGVEFSFSCVFEFEFAKLQTPNCDVSQCNPNRWSKYRVRLHLFRFLVIFVISTIYVDNNASAQKSYTYVLHFLLTNFLFQIQQASRRGDFNQPLVNVHNWHNVSDERYVHVILHDIDFNFSIFVRLCFHLWLHEHLHQILLTSAAIYVFNYTYNFSFAFVHNHRQTIQVLAVKRILFFDFRSTFRPDVYASSNHCLRHRAVRAAFKLHNRFRPSFTCYPSSIDDSHKLSFRYRSIVVVVLRRSSLRNIFHVQFYPRVHKPFLDKVRQR
mmetsp:Transcript_3141/g.9697  ORF Transcript_3141/g.9697 Transcript_3141/m.9697 type:complete len:291 (+) Transcript_3141:1218-2090(+)